MKSNNLIDQILGSAAKNTGFTAADMFTETNPHGYISKSNLRPFLIEVGKIGAFHLTQLSATLNYMKDGVRISNLIQEETDDKGRKTAWLRFKPGSTSIPVKVYLTENLIEFFKAYQKELINPDFSLEELLQEAEK